VTLQGKHVLITGASSGIGQAAAQALAADGATLTLLCRSRERGEDTARRIAQESGGAPADVLLADFNSLESVRAAANSYLDSGKPLDVLLNNAGVINTRRRETEDGFEQTFAVNHLAPFLLTGLLLPRLLASGNGRIVNVASNAHEFCRGMDFEDLQTQGRYKTFNVYGRSKLANILFTRELSRRLENSGLTTNCLHPGAVATGMGTNNGGWISTLLPALLRPFFRTPAKGAETAVFLCRDPAVIDCSGGYYYNCREIQPKPWAQSDADARRLWQVSEQLVDFNYHMGQRDNGLQDGF